jgi:hypothetical protein
MQSVGDDVGWRKHPGEDESRPRGGKVGLEDAVLVWGLNPGLARQGIGESWPSLGPTDGGLGRGEAGLGEAA